jgi:hypothetical protein
MGATLTQQRRVWEEGLRVVNHFYPGRKGASEHGVPMTVPGE